MRTLSLCVLDALLFAGALVLPCAWAQTNEGLATVGTCPPNANYEQLGYRIRSAKIREPFAFVRRVDQLVDLAGTIAGRLTGTSFKYAAVLEVRDKIADLKWLPTTSDHRVQIDALITSVENCAADELDVTYSVYSSQIAALQSLTWEGRQQEQASPQSVAGIDQERGIMAVRPLLNYNASEQLGGGISAAYRPRYASGFINRASVSAAKAEKGRALETTLTGSKEYDTRWLSASAWTISYSYNTTPALSTELRRAQATAQYSLSTQPIGGILPIRVGLQFGGGKNDGTNVATASLGSSDTTRHYLSTKLLAGLSGSAKGNAFSASYGIEFGTVRGQQEQWHKHLLDIADDFSVSVPKHHPLDVESRLTLGRLHARSDVPIGIGFFGGNKEELFTPDTQWQIRSNPVIRSLPANRFTLGTRADAFVSYNLTISYPLKYVPVVPAALTADQSFNQMLDKQLVSAQNTLAVDYYAKDPHVAAAAKFLTDIVKELDQMKNATAALQTRLNDTTRPLYTSCANAINIAERRSVAAQKAKGAAQYGDFGPLVPASDHENGEDRLRAVMAACRALNMELNDPGITVELDRLESTTERMLSEFRQIDRAKAAESAMRELDPAKQTLHRLLYDVNFFSVGPAFMFDIARLSDGPNVLNRYGLGGGLRFTLVSSVNMTIGYVANGNRMPGEPRGALTLSLQFRDLLQ